MVEHGQHWCTLTDCNDLWTEVLVEMSLQLVACSDGERQLRHGAAEFIQYLDSFRLDEIHLARTTQRLLLNNIHNNIVVFHR